MHVKKILFLLLNAVSLMSNAADDLEIKVVSRNDSNARYAIGLLELAISKIKKDYKIKTTPGELTAMRLQESTKSGTIDVIWTATNKELEEELTPVRIPLEKGLLGHRIFIVHRDNKNLLANVETLDDLKKFTIGQGRGWTDAEILRANGFKVILAPKYESLFYMVDGKRFQLFPRGVNEPHTEIEKRKDLDLAIDDHVMLVYKMPYYFFVNPAKKQLADDIEAGLNAAIEDGSFDNFFYSDETTQKVIKNVTSNGRHIFELVNPNLPPKTQLTNPKLWIRFEDLQNHRS